jgi:protein SCO1/2
VKLVGFVPPATVDALPGNHDYPWGVGASRLASQDAAASSSKNSMCRPACHAHYASRPLALSRNEPVSASLRPNEVADRRSRVGRAFGVVAALPFAWAMLSALLGCTHTRSAQYDLRGEIVGVVAERQAWLVHHEEIPGYMPAMTMEFAVGASDFSALREGQRIAARLTETAPGQFRLDRIRLLPPAAPDPVDTAARELVAATAARGQRPSLRPGEITPDFALYDQDGRIVTAERFRGRRVVLNFIYTRCPVPTMCPALVANLRDLQRLARIRAVNDLEIVCISLDPEFDTPPVLKAYATARALDTSNFTLLTGPEPAIRALLTQFAVLAIPSGNLWAHSLSTIVLDRESRLAFSIPEADWTPAALLERL